ncbi:MULTISPECIES: diaminopimelate epimerase [Streptomyces]|uniref:hypothetical protein n=1 Tax=Streptomyces TaxID=1883 RepID=UPI001CCE13F8|nr:MULTISPECIES: hypothetical protein [Streptomyces]UBI35557.1 hypothetical protein K7I03_03110 [Streptomyces mobaraensis]UKW28151.1 hypothetical protein MCU78_03140 [Streptomyces sp. TYQ1024]
MRFRKIHGAGNDFILFTNPRLNAQTDWSKEAARLCARRTGVGADGLVVSRFVSGSRTVLEIECFNADGSIATMCGNALRCAAVSSGRSPKRSQGSPSPASEEVLLLGRRLLA